MTEKMAERENCLKFSARYVLVAVLIVLGSLSSLLFTAFRFDEKADSSRYEALFSGKHFTENELLEVTMAFAAAELNDYRISEGVVEVPKRQKNAFVLALKKTSLFESEKEAGSSSGFWISATERQAENLKKKQIALANQLRTFHGIEDAHVILDICESRKGFVREKQATASVSIRSRSGCEISRDDVQAILNLVTGAVCGLSSRNVFIVDTRTNQSWNFNEPEIEEISENSSSEDRINLRKIVFQGEDLPRPELFDSAAREILWRENESQETKMNVNSLSTESFSERSGSLESGLLGNSEDVSVPGPIRITGGKVVLGRKDREIVRNPERETFISDPYVLPVSGMEVRETALSESCSHGETAQTLLEFEQAGIPALPAKNNPAVGTLSDEIAETSEELRKNGGNLLLAGERSPGPWAWEVTALLGITAVLVCGICLLVLFMTRKGLFVTPSPDRQLKEKEEEEKKTEEGKEQEPEIDFQKEAFQEADHSQNSSENVLISEVAPVVMKTVPPVNFLSEVSQSEDMIENEGKDYSETEREIGEAVPRGISEILSELDSIKQEEALEEKLLSDEVSIREKVLLPEIEKLLQIPARQLALGFLEERPQTAAMLLTHFPKAQCADVLEQIPTNRRLEIEARMADCFIPDEEILRDAAEVILEHLEELDGLGEWNSESGLSPAEILFQNEETRSRPSIRPLGEVLPRGEFSETDKEKQDFPKTSDEFRDDVEFLFEAAENHDTVSALESEDSEAFVSDDGMRFASAASVSEEASTSEIVELFSDFENREALEFTDLKYFSDTALKGILTFSPSDEVIMALFGAESELIDRVLRVLPKSEASLLKKQLKQPGRIRLLDVEAARQRIMKRILELAERGKIDLPQMTENI